MKTTTDKPITPTEASGAPSRVQSTGVVRRSFADKFAMDLPDVGLGTQRTAGTYIAMLAGLEGCREQAIEVLAGACSELGITGAEIFHAQKGHKATWFHDEPEGIAHQEEADRLEKQAEFFFA